MKITKTSDFEKAMSILLSNFVDSKDTKDNYSLHIRIETNKEKSSKIDALVRCGLLKSSQPLIFEYAGKSLYGIIALGENGEYGIKIDGRVETASGAAKTARRILLGPDRAPMNMNGNIWWRCENYGTSISIEKLYKIAFA